jgi:hypothetical protein
MPSTTPRTVATVTLASGAAAIAGEPRDAAAQRPVMASAVAEEKERR